MIDETPELEGETYEDKNVKPLALDRTCRLKAEETCSHSHQHSRASLYVQKAYDSGQPGLCMMQSRLTLLANLLLTFCRAGIHSCASQPLAILSPPHLLSAQSQRAQCRQELMAPISLCGHGASWPCPGANASDSPCLAKRSDSRATIECQNLEEREFKEERWHQLEGFESQDVLEGL